MQKTNTKEVELRGLLNEKDYRRVQKFLSEKARNLGEDDKDVYFFIFPDKNLKVVNNVSEETAKIVFKDKRVGQGVGFEEIEIPIAQSEVDKAVGVFIGLGFTEQQRSYQKRHNYNYKGVEIALKHSQMWGYHIEFEIIADEENQPEAEGKIREVAKELGVKLLTEEETAKLAKELDEKYRKGEFSR